ncbi:glutathione peroxidase [Sediminitomix flava]|uniref:Glutathione peroxidase n=1 Tax=Sediminitomix flava TaxID=379075 RepID=A0A315ZEJ4_SEDFL|nr:glutathione peroxidase [Sediminitomix flava]PWJ43951.1 glutathione peroxidase [Sediminitomix flava]
MKSIYTLLTFCFLLIGFTSCFKGAKQAPEEMESTSSVNESAAFYDFKMPSLDGEEIDFERYKGKKVLLVNVASKCGYTPQYTELQKLHEQYGEKVAILGFPANNFGKQEPGTNEEIGAFCQKNYGVSFQMFSKVSVAGDDKVELYQWLSDKTQNGWNDQEPKWNFTKYVIDENGKLTHYFESGVAPMDEKLLTALDVKS